MKVTVVIESLTLICVMGGVATFAMNLIQTRKENRRRRKNIIDAVYYHADFAVDLFTAFLTSVGEVRRNIEKYTDYTPFVAQSEANLTYGQIIDVLEWLSETEEEKLVLKYYHEQMIFHALALSFNSEIVRDSWCQGRKLALLDKCEKCAEDVRGHAQKTMVILEKYLDHDGRAKKPSRQS